MTGTFLLRGERWKVELDVRDVDGHLDTTLRKRATALSGRVRNKLGKIPVVGAGWNYLLPRFFAVCSVGRRVPFSRPRWHTVFAVWLSWSEERATPGEIPGVVPPGSRCQLAPRLC